MQERIRAIHRRQTDRSRTRAQQDAAGLVLSEAARPRPVLVATDPKRMVAPLLAKGGPSERKRAEANGKVTLPAAPSMPGVFAMSAKDQRALRANLHMTRIGLKARRVAVLCEREGVIHSTPGHEGTTQWCAGCKGTVPKLMDIRVHRCPHCGLVLPRDHNSALITLGRSLRECRDGPDPGGRVAPARADRDKRDAA